MKKLFIGVGKSAVNYAPVVITFGELSSGLP